MGQPKMLLPWGNVSVLEHVISVFAGAGIQDILVVTGAVHEQIEQAISTYGQRYPVRIVFNEKHLRGEMLSSLQLGIRALLASPFHHTARSAALVGLGDQPQVQERTINLICEAFTQNAGNLVVPSFQMRRGHPWLIARSLWEDLLELHPPQSPREFLNRHADEIYYVNVDSPSILADLDTPEDYRSSRP